MVEDKYVNSSALPWKEFGGGVDFKLLRTSQETGTWTVLFRCAAGSSIAPHRHLGGGEYLMVKGKMEVRGGAENGGITAITGDYGYEPNGVLHDSTSFPEYTELYFTNNGAIQFLTEDLQPDFVLDYEKLEQINAAANEVA